MMFFSFLIFYYICKVPTDVTNKQLMKWYLIYVLKLTLYCMTYLHFSMVSFPYLLWSQSFSHALLYILGKTKIKYFIIFFILSVSSDDTFKEVIGCGRL